MHGIECAFTGRIGRDPELKHVRGGSLTLLSFSMVVDQPPAKNGEPDQQGTWIRVAVFGDRAVELATKLGKGDYCYIEGRLSLCRWHGADGADRAGLSVVATLVQALGQIGHRLPRRERQPRNHAPAAPTRSGRGRRSTTNANQPPIAAAEPEAIPDDPIGF